MPFEFPFNMIGVDGRIFNRPVMRVIKSSYTYGGPKQGFWRCFADGQDISKIWVRFYELDTTWIEDLDTTNGKGRGGGGGHLIPQTIGLTES